MNVRKANVKMVAAQTLRVVLHANVHQDLTFHQMERHVQIMMNAAKLGCVLMAFVSTWMVVLSVSVKADSNYHRLVMPV